RAPRPLVTSPLSLPDALPILAGWRHRGEAAATAVSAGLASAVNDQGGPTATNRNHRRFAVHRSKYRASAVLLVGGECRRCQPLRSEEHTSELQSLRHLVCRLL